MIYDNIILGAGPSSLQLAYYFQKNNINYIVIEKESTCASFFYKYPHTNNLISLNKKYTGNTNKDFNFTINSSLGSSSDFTVTGTFPVWNPETKETDIKEFQESSTIFGSDLSNFRNQLITELFPDIKQNLIDDYNNLSKYGIK